MADKVMQTSNGGQYYDVGAAATLKTFFTGAYRACKIIVRSSGSAATTFYDNTALSGTEVFTIPASPTVGAIYDVQIPCSTGLTCGTTNTSAVTVTYSKDGANGLAS